MTVHIRTIDAAKDDLSDDDYKEIYYELRQYDDEAGSFAVSLRKFTKAVSPEMSHAVWSKYDCGKIELSRRMRNDLRAAVNLPELPITIEEAMTDVDPNAEVRLADASDGPIDLVILSNKESDLGTRKINPGRRRRRLIRPVASSVQDERRESIGVAWKEVIEAGLEALEKQ